MFVPERHGRLWAACHGSDRTEQYDKLLSLNTLAPLQYGRFIVFPCITLHTEL